MKSQITMLTTLFAVLLVLPGCHPCLFPDCQTEATNPDFRDALAIYSFRKRLKKPRCELTGKQVKFLFADMLKGKSPE